VQDIDNMIDAQLAGVPDLEQINKLAELIEWHSHTVTAYLAQRRMDLIRKLSEHYTLEEIQRTTGISPSRVRKVMNR